MKECPVSITFTAPSKLRPIKGNRQQRKTAAFVNSKTVWGLVKKFSARSPKADKKQERLHVNRYKRSCRNYENSVLMHEAQLRRLKEQDVPLTWQYWDEVTEYMKKHKSDHEEA